MFDNMPRRSGKARAPGAGAAELSELDLYLQADTEEVDDPIMWWHKRRDVYPALSRMALNYLTIPGMCPSCSTPAC